MHEWIAFELLREERSRALGVWPDNWQYVLITLVARILTVRALPNETMDDGTDGAAA